MSGLANTTMAYLVVKTLVPYTTALGKATPLDVQLMTLLALVVVEVTVARQNLRVGRSENLSAMTRRIMNLSNKSLSVKTI